MVEILSQVREKISTILFFCTKTRKTFDCFLKYGGVNVKATQGKAKAAAGNESKTWRKIEC